jgi:membrane-bound lytic murein transglycosylase D
VPESKFVVKKTFPIIDLNGGSPNGVVKVNGMAGVVAKAGDKVTTLADQTGTDLRLFLKYNDIKVDHRPVEGQVYYLQSKRNKAGLHEHVVSQGETFWQISQMYGIKLDKLLQKNRLKKAETLKEGRVLWLRFIRPANVPIEYRQAPTPPAPMAVEEKQVVVERTLPKTPKQEEKPVVQIESKPEMEISVTDTPQVTESLATEEETPVVERVLLTHKVAPKETLYAISKIYQVSILDIVEWNNLKFEEGLSIGQELKILADKQLAQAGVSSPKPVSYTNGASPSGPLKYAVQPGDTLYKIARDHGVTIKELMDWNNKKDIALSTGEILIVKP